MEGWAAVEVDEGRMSGVFAAQLVGAGLGGGAAGAPGELSDSGEGCVCSAVVWYCSFCIPAWSFTWTVREMERSVVGRLQGDAGHTIRRTEMRGERGERDLGFDVALTQQPQPVAAP